MRWLLQPRLDLEPQSGLSYVFAHTQRALFRSVFVMATPPYGYDCKPRISCSSTLNSGERSTAGNFCESFLFQRGSAGKLNPERERDVTSSIPLPMLAAVKMASFELVHRCTGH